MSRRESRESMDYIRGLNDMKREMEAKLKEMEGKLRAKTKNLVLKERSYWKKEILELLEENKGLKMKLSVTEQQNNDLKDDLDQASKVLKIKDEKISSLNRSLSDLEEKRAAQVGSPQQSILPQSQQTERVRTAAESSRLRAKENRWQKNVAQLEELLTKKDHQINKAITMRRRRTDAHLDTLVQLNKVEAALKQSQLSCKALGENLPKRLAEREEQYQKELQKKEETFQIELSAAVHNIRQELSKMSESWKKRAQQLDKEKGEVEEMLLVKEKLWLYLEAEKNEEIQHLVNQNLHLQKLKAEKQEWSFWNWNS